ncbi:MAG: hypothetical protein QXM38_02585 [Candidatus Aenigmatarchaeota archaeon]
MFMVTVGQENTNGENKIKDSRETVVKQIDRDPKTGRFVKGNLAAFKHGMRARRFKIIDCDSCYIRDRCSFYQAGAICAFKKIIIKKYNTRNVEQLINLMWNELEDIDRRLEVAKWYEVKDGGMLDKNIDRLLLVKIHLMKVLGEMYQSPTIVQKIEKTHQSAILEKFDIIYEAYMKKKEEEMKRKSLEKN